MKPTHEKATITMTVRKPRLVYSSFMRLRKYAFDAFQVGATKSLVFSILGSCRFVL